MVVAVVVGVVWCGEAGISLRMWSSFTRAPPVPRGYSLGGKEVPVSIAYWRHHQSQQSPTVSESLEVTPTHRVVQKLFR